MYLYTYLIVQASFDGEARSCAEQFINDHTLEFFDYARLDSDEKIEPVLHVRDELVRRRERAEKYLEELSREIRKCRRKGNRFMEGYYYKRYGSILCEDFCQDMPYFNICTGDWSIPGGLDRFAVPVIFHY